MNVNVNHTVNVSGTINHKFDATPDHAVADALNAMEIKMSSLDDKLERLKARGQADAQAIKDAVSAKAAEIIAAFADLIAKGADTAAAEAKVDGMLNSLQTDADAIIAGVHGIDQPAPPEPPAPPVNPPAAPPVA